MAERYLIASGNVSDPANWFGGNKPTVGDTAHANGFTGTIDEDISADTWTTVAGATAVAGGGFVLLDGFTLTGSVTGTTVCVTYSGSSEATIDGTVIGGSTVGISRAAQHNGTGHLIVTGGISGGSSNGFRGLTFSAGAGGKLSIYGPVVGGNGSPSHGLEVLGNGANRTIEIRSDVRGGSGAGRGIHQVSQGVHTVIWGHVHGVGNSGYVLDTGTDSGTGTNLVEVYGTVATLSGLSRGILVRSVASQTIRVRGSATALNDAERAAIELFSGGHVLSVDGGVCGGKVDGAYGIHSTVSAGGASLIDVKGSVVGGAHPNAHGIQNDNDSTIRVGGQSVDNPSGALGISNPGGGEVTTEYLVDMPPLYIFEVACGEGGKVMITLLKNGINAESLVSGTPTIDIRNFARETVIGGAKDLTLDDDVWSYQHPTNVIQRGKIHYARVSAVIDGVAQNMPERPFIAG